MHHWRSLNRTFLFFGIPNNILIFHICHLESFYLTSLIGLLHFICTSKSFIHSKIFRSFSQNHLLIFLCPPHPQKRTPLFFFLKLSVSLLLGERRQKMAKGMRFVQTWGEVSPKLIESHQKQQQQFANLPKLETIVEEGCCVDSFAVRAPKRIVIFLPIVLSMIMYMVLHKSIKDS